MSTFADLFDDDSTEHTVVEQKPHWSTLKRKFIAAFSAITVVKPTKEDHNAAKLRADELLMPRDSEPELTNARWTAKLDMARNKAAQVEADAEVSMFRHWSLAVREQEMQPESEPLPSMSIAAPYVIPQARPARPFYSFAEEQAALAQTTMPMRKIANPISRVNPRHIAVLGALAGVFAAITYVAVTGGSPNAMAAAAPMMKMTVTQPTIKTTPVITTQPVALTTEAVKLPPIEHRFDAPVVPTIAPVAVSIETASVKRATVKRVTKSRVAAAPVKAKSFKGKRAPIVVNTSTALGDMRPSRR